MKIQSLLKPKKQYQLDNVFVKGTFDDIAIHPNDIDQRGYKTCYLLAALAAIAQTKPDYIYKIIKPNKGGSYKVRFYNDGKRSFEWMPVSAQDLQNMKRDKYRVNNGDKNELWPAIIEKAYANWYDYYNLNESPKSLEQEAQGLPGENNYHLIEIGFIENSFLHLLGKKPTIIRHNFIEEKHFQKALKKNQPILASTYQNKNSQALFFTVGNQNIAYSHTYYLNKYDFNKHEATFRNPWGWNNNILKLKIDQIPQAFQRIAIGRY
jgi:hypothetical protein